MEDAKQSIVAEYFEGLRMRRFLLPRFVDFEKYFFYPRELCPHCLSDRIEMVESKGKGIIYSYTVVHQAPNEFFASKTPYILALVELDEGVRMMSNIVEAGNKPLAVGVKVELDFVESEKFGFLPVFKPVDV